MSITSISADGKRISVFEPEYKPNDIPTDAYTYMRKYDPVLEEWFLVEMPKPISRMVGQIPNLDKEIE